MLIYNIQNKRKGVISVSVGANIKKRRYELRMSQQELAEAMGYKTRSTIAKIEAEENDVSQKKLQKFAAVLETTVAELIGTQQTVPTPEAALQGDDRKNRNVAIILAGGKAGRNRQNIPSQFVNVQGKPILVYCMEAYQAHPSVDDIYVVCLRGWERIVSAYVKQYGITKLKGIIPGGNTGMASLQNAVEHIRERCSPEDFVIIQEATRPMVSVETISRLLLACQEKGSATICHSMKEYVQFHVSGGKAEYVERETMIAMQSPEVHRLSLLQEVFQKAMAYDHPLTESCCTMLLHNLGYDINFIESNVNNIKISREEDIAAFSALVREK